MKIRNPNNFDAIRFAASTLVIFSHSFPLVLNSEMEPLNLLTLGRINGGKIAVFIFFILSGFLISNSWVNNKDITTYISSRIRRIIPGLLFALLITTIIFLFTTTSRPIEYLKSSVLYTM
jgi:peptidoglycan/LPS O-acetylase OafA/YrhL